ncbi:hypothetical protein BDW59DRAFT_58852 [Aspergillus cavernicola]|uniref:Uncharacterized protein n=1 Tax=Aspergillus cavernicola TaxID=176166 RepID=A0ABR4H776_9EURO
MKRERRKAAGSLKDCGAAVPLFWMAGGFGGNKRMYKKHFPSHLPSRMINSAFHIDTFRPWNPPLPKSHPSHNSFSLPASPLPFMDCPTLPQRPLNMTPPRITLPVTKTANSSTRSPPGHQARRACIAASDHALHSALVTESTRDMLQDRAHHMGIAVSAYRALRKYDDKPVPQYQTRLLCLTFRMSQATPLNCRPQFMIA